MCSKRPEGQGIWGLAFRVEMVFKGTGWDNITQGVSVAQGKVQGLRLRSRQPVSLGAYYAPSTL